MINNKVVKFLFYGVALFSLSTINGQNTNSIIAVQQCKKNVLNFEVATAVWWSGISLNYEREIFLFHYLSVGGKLGIGPMMTGDPGGGGHSGIVLRPAIILMSNTNINKFEVEFGLCKTISGKVFIFSYRYKGILPLLNIGYRYQKNRYSYRLFIGTTGIGMGFGYAF